MVNNNNNKRPKAKKGAASRPRPQPRAVPRARPFIPHCIKEYTAALADPWNAAPCCRPDEHSLRSFKTKVRSRGTFQIGTSGMGFVVGSPVAFNDDDVHSVIATNSSFTGTTVVLDGAVTGVDLITVPKSFDPNSGIGARVTSVGIRVCYTGTELNRGGLIYANAGVGNTSRTFSGLDASALGTFETTKILKPDSNRSWVGVSKKRSDFNDGWVSTSTGTYSLHTFGFIVVGVPGESYAYDFSMLIEYIPLDNQTLVPSLTESYSAGNMAGQVDSVFNNARGVIMKAGSGSPSFLQKIENVMENAPDIIDTVSRYISLGGKALEYASMAL